MECGRLFGMELEIVGLSQTLLVRARSYKYQAVIIQ
jgi:hypothetical protein